MPEEIANEADVFVAHTPHQVLLCRNIRHSWQISRFEAIGNEEKTAYRLLKWDQVVARRLYCTRCGTQKSEYFARENRMKPFERVQGQYEYIKGYTYKKAQHDGVPAPSRMAYFEELLDRKMF